MHIKIPCLKEWAHVNLSKELNYRYMYDNKSQTFLRIKIPTLDQNQNANNVYIKIAHILFFYRALNIDF